MPKTTITVSTTYSYEELSPEAKEVAVGEFQRELYEWNSSDNIWCEFTVEFWKEVLEIFGVSEPKIYFSGFCSQGDGAQFNGSYEYSKGWKEELLKEFPTFPENHPRTWASMLEIQALQKKMFYGVNCSIKQSGHYYHEAGTSFDFDHEEENLYLTDLFEDICEEIEENMRYMMQNIYRSLEEEWNYQNSKEVVKKYLEEGNSYEFSIEGNFIP